GGASPAEINLSLNIGTIPQQIVVSATGTEVPESQVGASVSLITSDQFQEKLPVFETLRQFPGAQVVRTGQQGSTDFLFVRGGESTDKKHFLDGVSANDTGGRVNFGR